MQRVAEEWRAWLCYRTPADLKGLPGGPASMGWPGGEEEERMQIAVRSAPFRLRREPGKGRGAWEPEAGIGKFEQ